MRDRAVPAADVITPNQFELELLCGGATMDAAGLKAGLAAVHAMGPRAILVTSYLGQDTPSDSIDLVASDGVGLWRVRTPKLDISANGAGDATAALFFVHLLETRSVPDALARAASSVYGLLLRTVEAGSREIVLVAAQEEFVSPTTVFTPEAI